MSKPVMEEVIPQLFRAEIPLPKNPLKATNSYIIKSSHRNLIIDTGMNREECLTAMKAVLKELEIDLAQTDFFITHLHADHLGLVGELVVPSSRVFFNRPDADIVAMTDLWELLFHIAGRHGFPEEELKTSLALHPGNRYSATGPIDFEFVSEGDNLQYGPYTLECVHTPGHTSGHMCLYDRSRKIFFSGDHILGDITPNIAAWHDAENPLEEYLESLDKVYPMEIELLLPGHRRIVTDSKGRIRELKAHHQERLQEVASILKKSGPLNAYEVAAQMEWDIDVRSWEQFPVAQK
ncbi:MAG: MBL fold metallo-hydrolase, partial [Firmicutes bacterium]|nr:MBL fold metallo-hydrolase [Bacillota bacterium]